MSTGTQLRQWCSAHQVKAFEGVFCADNLPTELKDMGLIANHSNCNSPSGGTHWVACRIVNHSAYWFDSYGMPPYSALELAEMGTGADFRVWLRSLGITNVYYNARDMQSVGSDVCGLYACYFLKHGLPSQSPGAWKFLTVDRQSNDTMISQLVQLNKPAS